MRRILLVLVLVLVPAALLLLEAGFACSAAYGQDAGVIARAATPRAADHSKSADAARLDSLRALYALPDLPLMAVAATAAAAPASSLGSPTAFGAAWGDGFIGAGYQRRVRFRNLADGAVTAGGGIGDPRKTIGVEITATSYSTLRQGFGTNGSVSLKAHRIINRRLGIAIGYENAYPWGDTDGGSSLYAVATRLIPIRKDATHVFGGIGVSLGIGNARFRSEKNIRNQNAGINAFGSMSIRISEPVVAVADWTGQDLNVGAAIRLPGPLPLSISLGFADITHSAGDGARFIAGAGWAFRFK